MIERYRAFADRASRYFSGSDGRRANGILGSSLRPGPRKPPNDMHRPPILVLALLGSCAVHAGRRDARLRDDGEALAAPAEDSDASSPYHVGFLLGYRQLDDEDLWEPVEDQFALGVELVFEERASVVGWEFGLAASGWTEEQGEADVSGTLTEIHGGVRKTIEVGSLRPYLGGGLTLFAAETRAEEDFKGGKLVLRDDDDGYGVYWRTGVLWPLGARAQLGLDYRMMTGADVDLFRADGDADFAQLSLVLTNSF